MIILDTHALIWFVNEPKRLPTKVAKKIFEAINKEIIFASSISIWEIALLFKQDRLRLSSDLEAWVNKIETLPFIQFVPIDNQIAIKSVNLEGQFHNDPADRTIIATARELGAILVTGDTRIRDYPYVQTLW